MVAFVNRMVESVRGGLALSRKEKEALIFDLGNGESIEVWFVQVGNGRVRTLSKAPERIRILRNELVGKPAA